MARISLELIPRSREALLQDAAYIQAHPEFGVESVNIPDLSRFPLRSWEACAHIKEYVPHRIPHICAPSICIGLSDTQAYTTAITATGIQEVLVVSGDCPNTFATQQIYTTTIFDVLRTIRQLHRGVMVYAALDPYRGNLQSELGYCFRKLSEGFDGFFTQPFFDLNLLEVYRTTLPDIPIFWGLTPVITDSARAYWEQRNKVIFPRGYAPTTDWSHGFGKEFISHMRIHGEHCYIMPIRVPIETYLPAILG